MDAEIALGRYFCTYGNTGFVAIWKLRLVVWPAAWGTIALNLEHLAESVYLGGHVNQLVLLLHLLLFCPAHNCMCLTYW